MGDVLGGCSQICGDTSQMNHLKFNQKIQRAFLIGHSELLIGIILCTTDTVSRNECTRCTRAKIDRMCEVTSSHDYEIANLEIWSQNSKRITWLFW